MATVVVLAATLTAVACGTGVGVGLTRSHPSPWQGPWTDGIYAGGPVFR